MKLITIFCCVLFVVILETNFIEGCTTTVEGATLNVSSEDTVIVPAKDLEECQEECLKLEDCLAFTILHINPFPICYLFNKIGPTIACPECGSCTTGSVTRIKTGTKCLNEEENLLIAVLQAEYSEECSHMCSELHDCKFFVFHELSCLLYSSRCSIVDDCDICEFGELTCLTPDQCRDHLNLDDESRNIKHSKEDYHDYTTSNLNETSMQSPDWKGENWYRMVPPAGLFIPERSPGYYHCGTWGSGYMNGKHPTLIGETKVADVEFVNYGGNTAKIEVTKCHDDFFVYHLPETHRGINSRYCATDKIV